MNNQEIRRPDPDQELFALTSIWEILQKKILLPSEQAQELVIILEAVYKDMNGDLIVADPVLIRKYAETLEIIAQEIENCAEQ